MTVMPTVAGAAIFALAPTVLAVAGASIMALAPTVLAITGAAIMALAPAVLAITGRLPGGFSGGPGVGAALMNTRRLGVRTSRVGNHRSFRLRGHRWFAGFHCLLRRFRRFLPGIVLFRFLGTGDEQKNGGDGKDPNGFFQHDKPLKSKIARFIAEPDGPSYTPETS